MRCSSWISRCHASGTTSFDVAFDGHVGERRVFDAVITYVVVKMGTLEPIRVPPIVRDAADHAA